MCEGVGRGGGGYVLVLLCDIMSEIVQSMYGQKWPNLEQIATELFLWQSILKTFQKQYI